MEKQTAPQVHGPALPPIVLTTDFGLADPYVGVMKGVVLGINPGATLIDLSHQIQPQNVVQAAFVLGSSYRFFPADSIHAAVVDPGVGTSRRALLLVTPHGRFLAPDNGVLSHVLRDFLHDPPEQEGTVAIPDGLEAYNLTNSGYWLNPVSQTFHGRDVFAPVAAYLSLGVSPQALGQPANEMAWLPAPQPVHRGNTIQGEIINVDHFGNLVTNIPASALAGDGLQVSVKGRSISGLSQSYHGGARPSRGGLVALVGSYGLLEIAVRDGSAAQALEAGVGETVRVTARVQS